MELRLNLFYAFLHFRQLDRLFLFFGFVVLDFKPSFRDRVGIIFDVLLLDRNMLSLLGAANALKVKLLITFRDKLGERVF